MKATAQQVKALQALWGRYAAAADLDAGRETRLAWATGLLHRALASFKELSAAEAATLIDELKRELGQPVKTRRRMDREQAEHFARDGRKGYTPKVEVLATAEDLAEIERLRERAGMLAEEFEHWLRGRSSPVPGGKLLTISACNRVRWALRAMLRRKELETSVVERSGARDGSDRHAPLIPQGGTTPYETRKEGKGRAGRAARGEQRHALEFTPEPRSKRPRRAAL